MYSRLLVVIAAAGLENTTTQTLGYVHGRGVHHARLACQKTLIPWGPDEGSKGSVQKHLNFDRNYSSSIGCMTTILGLLWPHGS